MKSYEHDLQAMVAQHRQQQADLLKAQDAENTDRRRAHAEQWDELDQRHQRDWFELRRLHKKPIGPAGRVFLGEAVLFTGGKRNAHSR